MPERKKRCNCVGCQLGIISKERSKRQHRRKKSWCSSATARVASGQAAPTAAPRPTSLLQASTPSPFIFFELALCELGCWLFSAGGGTREF